LKTDFKGAFSEVSLEALESGYARSLIPHLQPKVKLVSELAAQLDPLLDPGVREVDPSALKWNKDEGMKAKIKEAISGLRSELQTRISASSSGVLAACGVDHAAVDSILRATCERFGLKLGDLTQPLRLFVTGHPSASIGLFDLLPLMPWNTVSARIEACLKS
jgi:hypothetical protein